MNMLKG